MNCIHNGANRFVIFGWNVVLTTINLFSFMNYVILSEFVNGGPPVHPSVVPFMLMIKHTHTVLGWDCMCRQHNTWLVQYWVQVVGFWECLLETDTLHPGDTVHACTGTAITNRLHDEPFVHTQHTRSPSDPNDITFDFMWGQRDPDFLYWVHGLLGIPPLLGPPLTSPSFLISFTFPTIHLF